MAVALVTGAGARLGQAMAIHLGQRGFDVAVHYASSDAGAKTTAEAVRAAGQRAETFQCDLLDEDATQALVGRVTDTLGGPVTVLVNNASIFDCDTIETATRDSWDRHMGSNLRAPFVLSQRVADQLPAPEIDDNGEPVAQGLIVNMLDQRVRKLTPEFMTYTLAKMALYAFTTTAAQALAPKARVNGIGPGPTLQGARQSEAHFQAQRAATVLQRGASPADIVAALEYLLNAPAVTGQMIAVDGGQHLAWQTPDVLGPE